MKFATTFLAGLIATILAMVAPAQSPPDLTNYQGTLLRPDGSPEIGPKTLEFRIVDEGNTTVWGPQTFPDLPLQQGKFNVLLGATDDAGSTITLAFQGPGDAARYMSVRVAGEPTERLPLQRIASVPFALSTRAQPMIPLTISSSIGWETVTQYPTQRLVLEFGEDVTGFALSDIALSGATADGFETLSPRRYGLNIIATGGRVSVSVPGGAAASANGSGHGNVPAGPHTNFYQDTWTLTLPGSVAMELIRIPAGTFTMGSPGEEPSRTSNETQYQVTISQDFYLSKTEVKQQQWLAIQSFPAAQTYVGDPMPVHNVSWTDVQMWLTALDAAIAEPGTFGLPTESQWEYAARAGTTTRFSFGDGFGTDENCSADLERTVNMWYCGNNSPSGTKSVGMKPANAWGLRDMYGNVGEWCSDWLGVYPVGSITDPTGSSSSDRVFRGGSWGDPAANCRSARRNGGPPSYRGSTVGFRVLAVR